MLSNSEHDFALERRLKEMDPALHQRFSDAVFALQFNLSNYKLIFPEYTDHTNLHSMTVIDFCNQLIGSQIDRLNADEIYLLLMGCYFHDTGMGITRKDYDEFINDIDFGDYFDTHDRDNFPEVIRSFHHEFSGRFIKKYARLFDIPSDEHTRAVIYISRGHRKTDLTDRSIYSPEYKLPNGNTACLPYLTALIRLADEIDVAAERNPILLYDIESLTDEVQIAENKKLQAVSDLEISKDSFTLITKKTNDQKLQDQIKTVAEKMQKTLNVCHDAIKDTPYIITQKSVGIRVLP